jgi:hypothetical protein
MARRRIETVYHLRLDTASSIYFACSQGIASSSLVLGEFLSVFQVFLKGSTVVPNHPD